MLYSIGKDRISHEARGPLILVRSLESSRGQRLPAWTVEGVDLLELLLQSPAQSVASIPSGIEPQPVHALAILCSAIAVIIDALPMADIFCLLELVLENFASRSVVVGANVDGVGDEEHIVGGCTRLVSRCNMQWGRLRISSKEVLG